MERLKKELENQYMACISAWRGNILKLMNCGTCKESPFFISLSLEGYSSLFCILVLWVSHRNGGLLLEFDVLREGNLLLVFE